VPRGLLDPSAVRELASQLALRPSKQRGQNFVTDANTVRRIVAASGVTADDIVLEVGPGLGSLTLGLLQATRRVIAIEIDDRLAAQLPRTVAARLPDRADALTVINADALRVSEIAVPPTAVVANLPYNVAVPVLLHLLEAFKVAWYAAASRAGSVSPAVFWPKPNVESGLVAIQRRAQPETKATRAQVFAVIDAAFGQRRKMLRSALAGLAGSSTAASAAIAAAGLDPQIRGEMLDVYDFARLAEQLFPS
jgi:16S rRNA (adenine1518-N6/adenine1519-N6)-dimethyltransferase